MSAGPPVSLETLKARAFHEALRLNPDKKPDDPVIYQDAVAILARKIDEAKTNGQDVLNAKFSTEERDAAKDLVSSTGHVLAEIAGHVVLGALSLTRGEFTQFVSRTRSLIDHRFADLSAPIRTQITKTTVASAATIAGDDKSQLAPARDATIDAYDRVRRGEHCRELLDASARGDHRVVAGLLYDHDDKFRRHIGQHWHRDGQDHPEDRERFVHGVEDAAHKLGQYNAEPAFRGELAVASSQRRRQDKLDLHSQSISGPAPGAKLRHDTAVAPALSAKLSLHIGI